MAAMSALPAPVMQYLLLTCCLLVLCSFLFKQVVRWQPRVLSMSSASMKLKAIALASVIGVPPTAIQDIFAKQPLLLNLSAKALVAKTRALKAALGYSDLQLWQVMFTKPGVLLFASNKLSSKWASLQELAGRSAGSGACCCVHVVTACVVG